MPIGLLVRPPCILLVAVGPVAGSQSCYLCSRDINSPHAYEAALHASHLLGVLLVVQFGLMHCLLGDMHAPCDTLAGQLDLSCGTLYCLQACFRGQ